LTAWWLCPNKPRCPHAAVVHDVEDFDDRRPRCCADGCQCGAAALVEPRPVPSFDTERWSDPT